MTTFLNLNCKILEGRQLDFIGHSNPFYFVSVLVNNQPTHLPDT